MTIIFQFLDHLRNSLFKTVCLWPSWSHPASSLWAGCFHLLSLHAVHRGSCASAGPEQASRVDGQRPEQV